MLDSKVLLIGAGETGSPIALYLAASGVGTIGFVDDDVVDESNLQRQVLHGVDRIGMRKVDSAEILIRGLNPETTVVKHVERLDAGNVERLIADYDVIVDGTDNFDTRYVLNDAAVRLRKPVVHGSIYRWDDQITTFVPFEGPCYRCMYPAAAGRAGAGVLDGRRPRRAARHRRHAPGEQVFKDVLGVGETLAGRLLMFDAMGTTFDEVRIWRDRLPCLRRGRGAPSPESRRRRWRRDGRRPHPARPARGTRAAAAASGDRHDRQRGPGRPVRQAPEHASA